MILRRDEAPVGAEQRTWLIVTTIAEPAILIKLNQSYIQSIRHFGRLTFVLCAERQPASQTTTRCSRLTQITNSLEKR